MVFAIEILFLSELISAFIAFVIVYLMIKSFSTIHDEALLGFPIGFSFLALSYVILGISYTLPMFQEDAAWTHLFIQTYGFGFLAITYFLKKRQMQGNPWVFTLLLVLIIATILIIVIPPHMVLPDYYLADEIFRIVNIGLLIYIIISLNKMLIQPEGVSNTVVMGFSLIAVSQFTLLIWALDGGFWSFALSHLLRIIGLFTLAAVLIRGFRRE